VGCLVAVELTAVTISITRTTAAIAVIVATAAVMGRIVDLLACFMSNWLLNSIFAWNETV
jgi:hypothetical protein